MKQIINKLHAKVYQNKVNKNFFSPGRVNLIGEHTDYSGGYVFPLAIDLGIYAAVSKRNDNQIFVYSDNFKREGKVKVDPNLVFNKNKSFINYIQGVLFVLKRHGFRTNQGLDITIISNLPVGAGLSSSAAIEILFLTIFKTYNNFKVKDLEMVKMAKQVENEYMGVATGIMDQFAVLMGKKGKAMFLQTDSLKVKYVPINLEKYTLVLMNTNKKRELVDSDYNERFASVKKAGIKLGKVLGELSIKEFKALSKKITDPKVLKRAKHVVNENARTKLAVKALNNKDYELLGRLMVQSHVSLKEDFDVSCQELDYLVEANLNLKALGARMTGAGFGGTMIALYKGKAPSFNTLKKKYHQKFNKPLDIYYAKASKGASLT